MIFGLYLGNSGKAFGMKVLAATLNGLGLTARGRRWTRGHVNDILANTAYIGELYFNRENVKKPGRKNRRANG